MKYDFDFPFDELCEIVCQISRRRYYWCIALLDESIERVVRSANRFGIDSTVTKDHFYETEGMLHFAMTANIISPDDYFNVISCLRALCFPPLN